MAVFPRPLQPSSIVDMTNLLDKSVALIIGYNKINVSLHEDNTVELILVETLTPQFIPWNKHYDSKTIWFLKEIHKHGVKLKKIATMEKLGGIFTNGIPRSGFY